MVSGTSTLALPPRGELQTGPVTYVLGLTFMLLGLTYAFYGYYLFFTTLFVSGLLLATNVIFTALITSQPFIVSSNASLTPLAYFGISIGCGLVMGGLTAWFWSSGMCMIGLVGGYAVGRLLLSSVDVDEVSIQLIVLIMIPGLMVILQSYAERPAIILSTAIAGSYTFVYGLDVVLNCGIAYDTENPGAGPSKQTFFEVGGIIVLTALAFAWQWWQYRRTFGGKRRKAQEHSGGSGWGAFAGEKAAIEAVFDRELKPMTSAHGGGGKYGVPLLELPGRRR